MAIEDGPITQTSADAACFTLTLTGSNRTDVAAVLNGAGHLLSADAACDPRPGNVAKVDAVFNGAGGIIDLAANAAGVYDTTTVRNVGFVGAVLDGTVFG